MIGVRHIYFVLVLTCYVSEGDTTSSLHTSLTTQSIDKSPTDQVRAENVPGEGRPTRPEL